ncbi:MAG TPA: hypothetical protein PLG99_04810 [Kaistiaceae bacterium]|nr:hypothetical protein [Kaistiaceae bacterium]
MKIRNKGAPVLAIAAMILAGSPGWHPAAAQEDPGEDPIQTMPIPGMVAPGGQWGNPGMQLDPRYGQQFAPQAPYGGPAGGPMVAPGYGGWGQRATPIEIPYIARPQVGQPAGPGYGQGGYGAPQFQAPGGFGPQADPRYGQAPVGGYGTAPYGVLPLPLPEPNRR